MTSRRSILKLIWPLALGMANSALMQFVDRAYLAHYSLEALEAVLPAGLLMWVFAGFFQSLIGYANVLVGQYHGANEPAKCLAAYRTATGVALAAGVLSVPLVFVGYAIFDFTASSPRLLADERSYFTIVMLGAVAAYGQMAAASYFTGRGRTRIVFWANLVGNALNVILDPILIFGWWGAPRLAIAGAAIATVVSQLVQWLILSVVAWREADCGRESSSVTGAVRRDILGRLLRFGVPSALYEMLNMISFTVFVFITEGVGALELAVSNACFSVNYILFAPMMGFSLGAQTLVAQAIGRKDPDGAAADARRTVILGALFAAAISVAALVFAHPILDLFAARAGESTAAFHDLGIRLLAIMGVWLLFDAVDIIIAGALKGAGDTKFVMMLSLVSSFAVWLPLVGIVKAFHNTMPMLWATMVVLVFVCFGASFVRWRRGNWRKIQVT